MSFNFSLGIVVYYTKQEMLLVYFTQVESFGVETALGEYSMHDIVEGIFLF